MLKNDGLLSYKYEKIIKELFNTLFIIRHILKLQSLPSGFISGAGEDMMYPWLSFSLTRFRAIIAATAAIRRPAKHELKTWVNWTCRLLLVWLLANKQSIR